MESSTNKFTSFVVLYLLLFYFCTIYGKIMYRKFTFHSIDSKFSCHSKLCIICFGDGTLNNPVYTHISHVVALSSNSAVFIPVL